MVCGRCKNEIECLARDANGNFYCAYCGCKINEEEIIFDEKDRNKKKSGKPAVKKI